MWFSCGNLKIRLNFSSNGVNLGPMKKRYTQGSLVTLFSKNKTLIKRIVVKDLGDSILVCRREDKMAARTGKSTPATIRVPKACVLEGPLLAHLKTNTRVESAR